MSHSYLLEADGCMGWLPTSMRACLCQCTVSICTHAYKHSAMRHFFMFHWSVTGNEKSKGERCNYSGICECEGEETWPIWPHGSFSTLRAHAHAHMDSQTQKHAQTKTSQTRRQQKKVVFDTGDTAPVHRPPATLHCKKKNVKLQQKAAR